ncbi:tRNA (guanine(37)-N(1))-methyltransferase [Chironomus tepperi]|uniref:tRNA (guanine(37)-N(1))-methyltransferase n=1 Tax=Chironomus tepperi TaxID=113505 RepID=UPI00391FAE15
MNSLNIITKSFVAYKFIRNMSLLPPKISVSSVLKREDFTKTISVPILKIDSQKVNLNNIVKLLQSSLLKVQKFQAVKDGKIFLNPDKVKNFEQLPVDDLKTSGINSSSFEFEDITLSYDNWKADELIRAIIPENLESVTSFSRIGHIIHLNLKDELLPYKSAISQIFLDKTPNCRTVINKAQSIENTYRNFQIELLRGDNDYKVQVKENGLTFEFDFSTVYWNPRLSTEHERLVNLLHPNDYLYDVFAGVGPFSVPAGKRRINVLANDLNPHSFRWLEHNVKKNKCENYVKTFNKDGREFILNDIKENLLSRIEKRDVDPVEYSIHIAMNLPALSVTFLNAFVGLLKGNDRGIKSSHLIPTPIIHCYLFVKGVDDSKCMAQELVEQHIGFKLIPSETLKEISFVRNVAPNKDMMRVDIFLTSDILFDNISQKRLNDSCNDDEVPSKKSCLNNGKEQEETK